MGEGGSMRCPNCGVAIELEAEGVRIAREHCTNCDGKGAKNGFICQICDGTGLQLVFRSVRGKAYAS